MDLLIKLEGYNTDRTIEKHSISIEEAKQIAIHEFTRIYSKLEKENKFEHKDVLDEILWLHDQLEEIDGEFTFTHDFNGMNLVIAVTD